MLTGEALNFSPQEISDVILIKPDLYSDNRGYFMETFRSDLFEKALGYKVKFVQDNESKSSKGVLRGLHYQTPPYEQAKLVRVVEGVVLDIAVDLRRSSATFGKHVAVKLTSKNKYQLYIPHGFAHGFVVLSDSATFVYKTDNFYNSKFERGILFNDKALNIDWSLPIDDLQLSEKDRNLPKLSDAKDLFD